MMVIILVVATCLLVALAFVSGWLYRAYREPNMMSDIVDFHERFELNYDGPPRVLPTELANFRIDFMQEELNEYRDAERDLVTLVDDQARPLIRKGNAIDQLLELELDALVDLTYVVLGTAYMQFGPAIFTEAWHRVHGANMMKVRKARATEGHTDSGRATQYDVVKPAGWTPPSHLDLIKTRHRPLTLRHPVPGVYSE